MTDDFTLELSRVIAAPRPTVFAAFIDGDTLARWWGPQGFSIPSIDFDPRAGARYRIEMQPPEGDAFHLRGEVRIVEAPERLAFTFAWEPPDSDDVENLVELTFSDRGERTEVALRQGPFKTEARWQLHRDGWSDSFDKLATLY